LARHAPGIAETTASSVRSKLQRNRTTGLLSVVLNTTHSISSLENTRDSKLKGASSRPPRVGHPFKQRAQSDNCPFRAIATHRVMRRPLYRRDFRFGPAAFGGATPSSRRILARLWRHLSNSATAGRKELSSRNFRKGRLRPNGHGLARPAPWHSTPSHTSKGGHTPAKASSKRRCSFRSRSPRDHHAGREFHQRLAKVRARVPAGYGLSFTCARSLRPRGFERGDNQLAILQPEYQPSAQNAQPHGPLPKETAVTSPVRPWRTESPRPSAAQHRAKRVHRIDLPRPSLAVSTFKPGWKAKFSSRSMIKNVQRISKLSSIARPPSVTPQAGPQITATRPGVRR